MTSEEAVKVGAVLLTFAVVAALLVYVVAPHIMEQRDGQDHRVRIGEGLKIRLSPDPYLAFNQGYFAFVVAGFGFLGLMFLSSLFD